MCQYFSMFIYFYIFYFLDNDNFTNISLSYFFLLYYISIMKLKKLSKQLKQILFLYFEFKIL